MNGPGGVKPSKRGLLTILALLGVGLLFLGGLYLTAYFSTSPEYRAAEAGVPGRTLRVATADLAWHGDAVERLVETLKREAIDVLLLQRVSRADAQRIGHGLGMSSGGALQMYYTPTDSGTKGNAILARHPLYKGRPMPRPTYPERIEPSPPGGFGVFAEVVVEGKRVLVGSAHFTAEADELEMQSLIDAWRRGGEIPLVVGATMDRVPGQGGGVVTITPEMDAVSGGAAFYVSAHWSGMPRPAGETGDAVFVLDLGVAAAPATGPATAPSEASR